MMTVAEVPERSRRLRVMLDHRRHDESYIAASCRRKRRSCVALHPRPSDVEILSDPQVPDLLLRSRSTSAFGRCTAQTGPKRKPLKLSMAEKGHSWLFKLGLACLREADSERSCYDDIKSR